MVYDFTQAICFGSCRWLKPSEQLLQEICHQRILQEFVSCGRRFCQMSCYNEQLPLWGSQTSFHKHSSQRYLNFYCQLLFPLFADKQECSGWTILLWCILCFCEDFLFSTDFLYIVVRIFPAGWLDSRSSVSCSWAWIYAVMHPGYQNHLKDWKWKEKVTETPEAMVKP